MLREHGLTKLLGDDSALPLICATEQKWLIDNWLPRAIDAGLHALATKTPDALFGQLAVSMVHSSAEAGLRVRSFRSLDEARRWLADA